MLMSQLRITSVSCRVCGRPLKNPASIAIGAGPVCRGGMKKSYSKLKDKETLDMFNAEFEYVFRKAGLVLVIYDLNRGAKSVTNDIENVLAKIKRDNPSKPWESLKIIYLDSEKQFDGVGHDHGVFKNFYHIGAQTEHEAIERVTHEEGGPCDTE